MPLKNVILIILFLLCQGMVHAQVTKTEQDSTSMYKKIEDYSKKRKLTKTLHKLIFRTTTKKPIKAPQNRPQQNLAPFEGKIIRHITIKSHDPFGFSFTDSTETANSWIEKTGNFIHIKTKAFAIRNTLLIKKNTPLDTLVLSETERLIRAQNFIRRVEITAKNVEPSKDSVDLHIEVLDSWSLIPTATASISKTKLKLKNRNFFGFGHEFSNSVIKSLEEGNYAFDMSYTVPNFKNTFIKTTVAYKTDLNGYYSKILNIDRPFYSPLTRWAGGIYLDEQYRKDSFQNGQFESGLESFRYLTQDFWGGHAFQLFKGNSEKERTTNLISSLRYLHVDYRERPTAAYDKIGYFTNESFYLGGVGIASRQFIKDDYIFRDGIIEDVPIGTVYAVTGGYQRKNQHNRMYLGARASHGNYFNWGYLSTNFEIGTFVNDSHLEQTTISLQANYFTNLISLGSNWKMRQFVKPQILIGTNRLASEGDRLTIDQSNKFRGVYDNNFDLKNGAGIQGFDSDLMGTKKYVLSLQTQFYSPWEVLGFRLNPYINFSAAMLGDEDASIKNSKVYSSIGAGFIIRNDYLVFSSFQLSFSFFPKIPGQGNNIFKTNAFETEDFGFQSFELGKPSPVWYN
ncbi:hypothetical protein LX77_02219 [Gelidibacter algens]|uniref:Outer membrane protein assembly factor BamA n=1 Tax=Gelidibacter algens TaxID=49280 RepID=A0A1A7R0C5_9FLAO|nr:hypothetical protein [Gelidibacter algens]OBX25700.1 hypothetical protein A9996_08920 [Gelidibacter algens]RAJ23059.1 hypothetical protein LX77_02219 [Gelidibacter algens]